MTTAQLVALLASEAGPVHRERCTRKLAIALGTGGLIAFSCAALIGHVSIRNSILSNPSGFALKSLYALSIALPALLSLSAHSRPGAERPPVRLPVALAVAIVGIASIAHSAGYPLARWPQLLSDFRPATCALAIVACSVPAFIALILALRTLAPTRLRTTGGLAGLAAGSVGSAVYALICTDNSPAHVFIWHSLGIILVAAAGWVMGPRLLRW